MQKKCSSSRESLGYAGICGLVGESPRWPLKLSVRSEIPSVEVVDLARGCYHRTPTGVLS